MSVVEFFVGWRRPVGPVLRRFLLVTALGLPAGMALLGAGLGAAAVDHAGAEFGRVPGAMAPSPLPIGETALEGVVTLAPYPVLHLPAGAGAPHGRSVLLADEGKLGAVLDPALEGRRVAVQGYALARGEIDMIVLAETPRLLDGAAAGVPAGGPAGGPAGLPVERLGRWRISGEICDGKCAGGGMRPGTGLGHRACATLCLDGALPALFVATAPVAGSAFLLLGAADGTRMPPALRARIGERVTLEGHLERRGAMLVFLAEAETVR